MTSSQLELPSISFFGRSFAEYLRFFALDPAQLVGRAVLDVAAGPASFTAEANARGIDAIAVDPLYGCTVDALRVHVLLDYRHMHAQLRAKPHLLRYRSFASIDAAVADRTAAAERFLDDYAAYFPHGRYRGGALPLLPFTDGRFDVVLCAHLLFVYAPQLDYAFHHAACRELVRVSRGEVRVHPVCGRDGQPYAELARLQADLACDGVQADVVPVDYEFFHGTGSLLRLRRIKA